MNILTPRYFARLCATLFFLTFFTTLYAQKQANIWSFGDFELDFNGPEVRIKREFPSHSMRSKGAISDHNGALLFYTDGYTVWNHEHNIMPNGEDLITGSQWKSTRKSVVVPKPQSDKSYYIFTVEPSIGLGSSGLSISEVDMDLDGGLGDVTIKDVKLLNNAVGVSVALHDNQQDVWIVATANYSNKLYVLLLTEEGLSEEVIEHTTDFSTWNPRPKFSPDGRKVAIEVEDRIILYDFNNVTGAVSNAMTFTFDDLTYYPNIYGLEFSSDATKMYTFEASFSSVFQFDLSFSSYEDIKKSRYMLPRYVNYNLLSEFQLAPDGRIYMSKGGGGGGTEHLGFIANPNAAGSEVVFKENGLYLNGGNSVIPTPVFIQNYFFKTSFSVDKTCQGVPIQFKVTNEYRIDSVRWEFGEGSTSTLRAPVMQYDSAGEYIVNLFAYYDGHTDTVSQQIIINPYTSFNLGEDFAACYGDKLLALSGLDSYLWSSGDTTKSITLTEGGMYVLTASNSWGCSYTDSVFVTINALPETALADSVRFNGSSSVELDAGKFSSYSWNTGETTRTVIIEEPGWYSVLISDDNGCKSSKSVFVGDALPYPQTEDWIWLNPLPSGSTGGDIHFVDDNTGFIITDSEIIRTTDGGTTWHIQQKIRHSRRIAFKNGIGYVVGDYGNVFKSTHNGGGWNKISSISDDNFNGVSVIHPDTVLITSDSKLYVSHDGGKSWSEKEIPQLEGQFFTPDIEHSFFTSATTGHIACRNGLILKTTDAGENWRVTYDVRYSSSHFLLIKFLSEKIGYATAGYGDIFKTEDGGETWKVISAPYHSIYGLFFVNEQVGYTCGEYGAIYKTTTGGASWEWAGFLDGYYDGSNMNALYFFDENNGFAVGYGGRIIKTTDGGKSWQGYSMTNGTINDIVFPTSQVGYALGENVFKTEDGGKTWLTVAADTLNKISHYRSAYFFSADVGLVTASNYYQTSTFLTTDGGNSWRPVEGGTAFSFVDDKVGYSAGSGIKKTTDGGISWTTVSYFNASDIHFISEQRGFAVTYNNLYKTIDGAETWQQVTGSYEYFNEIDFVNDDVGYISGNYGFILKTENGGETWKEIRIESGHNLTSIDFLTENIGFVVGEYGSNYFTSDGGITWTSYSTPFSIKTACLADERIFAGGTNGALVTRKFFAPDVTLKSLRADSITATSATLIAAVASNGSAVEDIRLEYGINGTYSNSIHLTPNTIEGGKNSSYAIRVDNLKEDTLYVFRLIAIVGGATQVSNNFSFETLPALYLNPPYPSYIKPTWVQISAQVISNMNDVTDIQIEYDTMSTFETKKVVTTDPATVEAGKVQWPMAILNDLKPNTWYYSRLKATHNGTVYTGDVGTFHTPPEYRIEFSSPIFENNQVTLRAFILSNNYDLLNLKFEYGLNRNFGTSVNTSPSNVQAAWWEQVSATITVPYKDSIYYYRIKGFYNGKPFYSEFEMFRLNGDVILLPEAAQDITETSATLHGRIGIQGNYLWSVNFEYGDGDSFEEVYVENFQQISNNTFYISTPIDSLAAGTQYQFRIKVVMWDGTIVYSDTKSFHTDIITGVPDKKSEEDLRLFPNPTNDQVHLISTTRIDQVEVLDGLGKTILVPTPGEYACSFSVSKFSSGIYYVRIVRSGIPIIRKFVRK